MILYNVNYFIYGSPLPMILYGIVKYHVQVVTKYIH